MGKENSVEVRLNKKAQRNSNNMLKRQAIFSTAKPWKAIFIMVTPPLIAVIIFSTYQILINELLHNEVDKALLIVIVKV